MKELMTDCQRGVYEFISDFYKKNKYSPTIREIAKGIGRSIATVQDHLEILRGVNALDWVRGKSRTIVLKEFKHS